MKRKWMAVLGVLLIVVGALSLLTGGITYTSRNDRFMLGEVEVEARSESSIPISPVLAGFVVIGGVCLIFFGRK